MLAVGESEQERMKFCLAAIKENESDPQTLEAATNQQYYDGMNVTIAQADKFITDVYGKRVKDIWTANHKIKCSLYRFFVIQQVLFLLGNGISFNEQTTLERLGKGFERKVRKAATNALNAGVSFGFWNLDHLDVFALTEFKPLYDEETGYLAAGIRYWRLADDKPLRVTLFELDGYTEYIKREGEDMTVLAEKRPYVQVVTTSSTGTEIAPGAAYPGFPIIPFYTHNRKSEMYGHRESIDGYDLIASQLLNNIDNFEFAYWLIKNAPDLANDPEALNEIYQRLKTSKLLALGEGQEVDEHRMEIPFEATDAGLKFMRDQLFADFMAFDPLSVSGGADTATRIIAAYEPLNEKTDLFEECVTEFIEGILELAGIDDKPTYTRSMVSNNTEQIANVLAARDFTDEEYTTKKVLELLGDADKVDAVLSRRDAEDMNRFADTVPEGAET